MLEFMLGRSPSGILERAAAPSGMWLPSWVHALSQTRCPSRWLWMGAKAKAGRLGIGQRLASDGARTV